MKNWGSEYLPCLPEGTKHRPVPGFPRYVVTDAGAVWRKRKPGWLRLCVDVDTSRPLKTPYHRVCLHLGGRKVRRFVHRIVLESFVGPCPPGMQCRHLDGEPANNCLANLAWGTIMENSADKERHGRVGRSPGARNGAAKLTDLQIQEIRVRRGLGMTLAQLASEYGVTFQTISKIARGSRWRHLLTSNAHRGEIHERLLVAERIRDASRAAGG